ncbi:MAG: hypothetical protein IPF99_27690 [Deltaproteobacteria bacterium]|nr:hypothetical protein [Deltaproteobacteria bacterium]
MQLVELAAGAAHEVEFVVVGGVAAVINGAPVTTFDSRHPSPQDSGERPSSGRRS